MMHLQHNSFYVNFLFKTYRWLFCQHRLIKNYYMTNNIVQVYLCTTKEHLNFKNIFNYTSCTGYILYLMYNMEYRLNQTEIWHTKRQVLPSYAECANLVVLKRTKTLKKVCVSNFLTCCPIHAIHEPYVD